MSNLLKSVTSKLAQSGLTTSNTTGNSSDEDPNEWQTVGIESPAESEAEQDEEELVAVRSQPATIPSTPASSSRPSSPPPATTGGARKKSGLDATWTSVSSAKVKNKKDPLRAFGSEISQKIFLQLPISALLRCSLVCKKWRKSATINYSYFKSIQSSVFDPSIQSPSLSSTSTSNTNPPSSSSGGAKWTRRESKTDWRLQYLKNLRIERRDSERSESNSMLSSGYSTPSRSQKLKEMGLITHSEKREQEWKIQKEEQEKGYSKDEMRDYYKGLGNKGGKVKGKKGKGGVKTGSVDDGGIWE